jgi:energy-coupling factor transporter ATP-binding protein EcfA2
MITKFHAQNLKGFVNVHTSLSPLTVLVGPNGAGKSTLLDGLHWLLQLAAPPKDPNPFGTAGFVFQRRRALSSVLRMPDARQLILEAEVDGEGWFQTFITADEKRGMSSVLLSQPNRKVAYPPAAFSSLTTEEGKQQFFQADFLTGLSSVVRMRLDAARLGEPSQAATERPDLRDDGSGLPTMLQFLAGERDGRLERIEADLRRLVPTFRRVHTPPTTLEVRTTELVRIGEEAIPRTVTNKVPAHRLEVEFDGIGRVPAEHVSEGTLLALGLLTLLHAFPPRTVLIDDADRALHPAAQGHLITLIKALMAERPQLQVVLTTHAPDLVDACAPEEVRVFGRAADGTPHIAELTAHPDAARWLKMMRVGEFWSTVGEGWVAGIGAS